MSLNERSQHDKHEILAPAGDKDSLIAAINNNADAVAELQTLYEELRSYVDDYFKGLDVQEEINNKLDDMVKEGQLQEIIG